MIKDGYKDEIIMNTQIQLGWRDRIRVLCGRHVHLQTRTQCENPPGKMETKSRVSVDPIFPRQMSGQVELMAVGGPNAEDS